MRAVYATDLSAAIETAIGSQTCLECLQRYGIDAIDLVTVTSPNVTTGMPGSDVGGRTKQALARQRRLLEDEGFTVETHVLRGTPHRRINGLADRVNADLIIVGSRGQSPLEQRFIGGTARNVARTAVRPLLVQRIVEGEKEPEVANEHLFQRVLYATDFSENAERAFDEFEQLQSATEEATLLHVAPPERRAGSEGDTDADAEAQLAELADRLESLGIETRTVVRAGEAADEILAAEEEFDPTTILMGSRGQGPIRRLLLGSTSETVTARARSNVLLVPPSKTR
ncbi:MULTISPECIES: universal stress protein [Halolamina]|uniref:Nucleotide-binding universal stress protein, UspA family n=1 Tax=Halolamina pelagica TaxID=699431 RepID=A0A1I5TMA1_9EURY|nr:MULTISPECIES: universal stress protein [Halolamina]NHX37736.1 universal stress protein [Halolamina sp. R1-12]SFP84202.1 Nucleotide-binding universal stress protein, UspA family [Halolamina pelagica]